jgi:polyphosphate glucokinase
MQILGIDVGGSGIKGAPVDVATGKLIAPRHRLETPASHRPKDMAETIAAIVKHFRWRGRVGCTFPGVIHGGVVHTAANLDPSWVGVDAEKLVRRVTRLRSLVLNDADAAGLAEIHYGASRNRRGVVLMLTLGPGSAVRSFSTDGSCPTPSSAISRCTARPPSGTRRTALASARICAGRNGPSV